VPEDDGVEIARVELGSVTSDLIQVRARSASSRIEYLIADEYDSEYVITPASSSLPLTLGELINLMDTCALDGEFNNPISVGLVSGALEGNIDSVNDVEELAGFVRVESRFYPELVAYYDDFVVSWIEKRRRNWSPPAEAGDAPSRAQ
jgi:hypothetical protein